MEKIGLSAADLKVRAQGLDADGELLDRALALVRNFISERRDRLVLYGGLGLDFMLRECDKRIYPDEERPDYDFYSCRSVDDAYDLAEILHKAGFPDVDARRARHVQTMRVRVSFVPVADISFVPPTVLDAIPRMEVSAASGVPITIVHPYWQFLDQHLALSFPMRDPPMEPVFSRFEKDVTRFNMLRDEYRPGDMLKDKPYDPTSDERIDVMFPVPDFFAMHGYAAYEAGQECLRVLSKGAEPNSEIDSRMPGGSTEIIINKEGLVTMSVPARLGKGPVSLVTTLDADAALDRLGYELMQEFRPMTDLVPTALHARPSASRWGEQAKSMKELVVLSTPLTLPASFRVGNNIHVVSLQYMMLHFLLGYHRRGGTYLDLLGLTPDEHLAMYEAGLALLGKGGDMLARIRTNWHGTEEQWMNAVSGTPFGLTVQVMGDLNIGESQLMSIGMDESATHQKIANPRIQKHVPSREESKTLPDATYRPASSKRREFDYSASQWFRLDGGIVSSGAE